MESLHTIAEFFFTTLLLGPLFVQAMPGNKNEWLLRIFIVTIGSAALFSSFGAFYGLLDQRSLS